MTKVKGKELNNIINSMTRLRNYGGRRYAKYLRNFRRYSFTQYASLDDLAEPSEIGWVQGDEVYSEEDTLPTPHLNVIKSCIDTLTSKIAQSKVRPFFNCVNGNYNDIQLVRQAQNYFDQLYDSQNVNRTVSLAFRDSAIFEQGIVYLDESTAKIERALPWQVYYSPAELQYNNGKIKTAYYERKNFPVSCLPDEVRNSLDKRYDEQEHLTWGVLYDSAKGKRYDIIDSLYVFEREFLGKNAPFIILHYNSPVRGDSSESVVDMLNNIQMEIDNLMAIISDAAELTPANTIFVPEGSNIAATQINNRIGNVMFYRLSPNMTTSPVSVATPNFISPEYMQLVQELKDAAYEMVGISALSATSQKPSGLDSGIALQTVENIESDRFETQLNQVVRAYVNIAKGCIDCFPEDLTILPKETTVKNLTWGQLKHQSENLVIQYSGADALSKDPSTKLQQLQLLSQVGVIPKSRIAQFMEIPDIEAGYSLANNALNAVQEIIEDCLYDDKYDIPKYIPTPVLKEEILSTQLSLKASGNEANNVLLDKLDKLYDKTVNMEMELTQLDNVGPEPIDPNSPQGQAQAMQAAMGAMLAPEQMGQDLGGLADLPPDLTASGQMPVNPDQPDLNLMTNPNSWNNG